MGKKGGLFFAIAAVIMATVIWGNPFSYLQAAFSPQNSSTESAALSIVTENLDVEIASLMGHVEAISQPRSTPAEKVAIRQYITNQLNEYGLAVNEQPYAHPETGEAATGGVNIVATLPGNQPNASTLVLGAHYDATENSPGADDNASAIAALLETARLLAPLVTPSSGEATPALPFPNTLKLVFFDQEERQPDGSGLLGSLAFTADASNLANVNGAIILDMIGYACRIEGCQQYPQGLPTQTLPTTGDFLAVVGLSDQPELIEAFTASARLIWPLVLSLPMPKSTLRMFPDLVRSDHAPFWDKGIPAVFVTDTANFRNVNYHTVRDTPETLDPTFFTGTAQHVVNAVVTMLNRVPSEAG